MASRCVRSSRSETSPLSALPSSGIRYRVCNKDSGWSARCDLTLGLRCSFGWAVRAVLDYRFNSGIKAILVEKPENVVTEAVKRRKSVLTAVVSKMLFPLVEWK